MKNFCYYHKATGVLHARGVSCNLDDETAATFVAANAPPDHISIEGTFDRTRQAVDVATGAVITRVQTSEEVTVAARAAALAGLVQLDASQHRTVLEQLLGDPDAQARLQAIADKKAELRKQL